MVALYGISQVLQTLENGVLCYMQTYTFLQLIYSDLIEHGRKFGFDILKYQLHAVALSCSSY
jgi:hypothetical protein